MKFLKDASGISELERRIENLEERLRDHEEAIKTLIDALRSHSSSIVYVSEHVKSLIDSLRTASKEEDHRYMTHFEDDTYN